MELRLVILVKLIMLLLLVQLLLFGTRFSLVSISKSTIMVAYTLRQKKAPEGATMNYGILSTEHIAAISEIEIINEDVPSVCSCVKI